MQWIKIRNKHGVLTEIPETRLPDMLKKGASVVGTYSEASSSVVSDTFDGVVAFTEDATFYSGGRYHFWLQMLMLVELGYKVRVYTTHKPTFLLDNFSGNYTLPEIVESGDWGRTHIKANLYFGSPFAGAIKALELAKEFSSPAVIQLFDPPTWLEREFPEEMSSSAILRDRIKRGDYSRFHVLTLTEGGVSDFSKWFGIDKSDFSEARPAINSRIIKLLSQNNERKDWIVAVSRNHPRKKWEETIVAFRPFSKTHQLHIFTNSEMGFYELAEQYNVPKESIVLHIKESDFQKFGHFVQAKALISSSHYEGYGMFVPEARACGLPVACYDLPTIKEIYQGRGMFKAPIGNVTELSHQLGRALKESPIPALYDHDFNTRAKELGDIIKGLIKEKRQVGVSGKPKKIAWVADYSLSQHQGGAQRTNQIIIDRGRELGYEIEEVNSDNFHLPEADLYILNNIHYIYWNYTPQLLEIIDSKPFIRYEHDYLWKIPMPFSEIQHIYDQSLLNIFLSPLHLEEHQKAGLKLERVHLQPSPIDTERFTRGEGKKGTVLYTGELAEHKGLLNIFSHASNNPDLKYDLYGWAGNMWEKLKEDMPRNCKVNTPLGYEKMPDLYRKYGKFIHMPLWIEPFGRTVAEAYLSGCELITNNKVGFQSYDWDYSDYEGVRQRLAEAPDLFWEKVGDL